MGKIHELLAKKYGFIESKEELDAVIEENRLHPCVVRCGQCRFVCPAQDVEFLTGIVKDSGKDHVRDISVQRTEAYRSL